MGAVTAQSDRRCPPARAGGALADGLSHIVEHGQAAGEISPGVDAHDFSVRLCALIDGLGKSVVLADPWMSRSRMLEICAGMIAAELEPAAGP